MRRGLISWSKTELPPSVLDARVARVQSAMAAAGVDALALYSDPARSSGAAWLTGFVPYWNRGVVVLQRGSKPILFTGMSNRVHGWIKTNAHLEAVNYSIKIGADVAKLVTEQKAGAVIAVPDINSVPSGILDGMSAHGASVIDGTSLLAKLRTAPDATELTFAFKAAAIARAALAKATAVEADGATLVGLVDGEARRLGAEEVYVGLAADLSKSRTMLRLEGTATLGAIFALRLSVAYKSVWVRMTRTLARDQAASSEIAAATERFATAVSSLPRLDAMTFPSWLVEGCRTTQPLEPLAGSMLSDGSKSAPGSYVSVQATIETASGPVLIGAPVLVGRSGETSACMASPQFEI
jgi:Xaa-Pro aminopeptidase